MAADATLKGPALPGELVAGLAGAETDAHFAFASEIVRALGKISEDLVPRLNVHPLADAIARGVQAFPDLVVDYKTNKDEHARAAVIDAIAAIIEHQHATAEVVTFLQKIMGSTKSGALKSLSARALALAGEQGFLEQQRQFLASDDLNDVRISARLVGFGKYQPAAETLLLLLRPDNMAVADVVVWALGEIGDPSALPKLHGLLSDLIYVEPTIEAVGQIGHSTSVIRLLPLLIEGSNGQREKTARALLRIARKQDGDLGDPDLQKATMVALERTVHGDDSMLARFYALVAYSVLGGHVEPAQIKRALGATLTDGEMGSLSAFFTSRKPDDGKPPPKRKSRKPF